jgi:hypothetical protein
MEEGGGDDDVGVVTGYRHLMRGRDSTMRRALCVVSENLRRMCEEMGVERGMEQWDTMESVGVLEEVVGEGEGE